MGWAQGSGGEAGIEAVGLSQQCRPGQELGGELEPGGALLRSDLGSALRRVVDRLEPLTPAWAHPMHGGSVPADVLPQYVAALREKPFAFDGRLFGRVLPE